MKRTLFTLALAAACAWPLSAPAQEPPPPAPAATVAPPASLTADNDRARSRRDLLLSHGINPAPADLIQFLTDGFSDQARARGFPVDPELKSEIVNLAIEELARLRDASAAPLLERYAREDVPPGVLRIVQEDIERQSVDLMDPTRRAILQFFSLNAVVAIGLIGEPSSLAVVREVTARQPASRFQIEGAIALALLGSMEGFPRLLQYTRQETGGEALEAFRAVYFITGRNYRITAQTSRRRLTETNTRLQEWWDGEGRTFTPVRDDIIRRRLSGVPSSIDADRGTLQGLLRDTRNPGSQTARVQARLRLRETAAGATTELRQLAEDPLTDNDVRIEALRWYAAYEPKEGRRLAKRLRRDENESVAQAARDLIEQMDSAGGR